MWDSNSLFFIQTISALYCSAHLLEWNDTYHAYLFFLFLAIMYTCVHVDRVHVQVFMCNQPLVWQKKKKKTLRKYENMARNHDLKKNRFSLYSLLPYLSNSHALMCSYANLSKIMLKTFTSPQNYSIKIFSSSQYFKLFHR